MSGNCGELTVRTWKKACVDPPAIHPYFILFCWARSLALVMVSSIRFTVRKAARLAVYEEIIMRVKNHHIPATMRVEMALEMGEKIRVPTIYAVGLVLVYRNHSNSTKRVWLQQNTRCRGQAAKSSKKQMQYFKVIISSVRLRKRHTSREILEHEMSAVRKIFFS